MTRHSTGSASLQKALLMLCPLLMTSASYSSAQDSTDSTQVAPPLAAIPLEFDVASVHEDKSSTNMHWTTTADGFDAVNTSLLALISAAYGIKPDLISGAPGWAKSTDYDVQAKVLGEDLPKLKQLDGQQRLAMLRPVLANRFQLKTHTVTRSLPVYDLIQAKSGAKLKPSSPIQESEEKDQKLLGMITSAPGKFTARRSGMNSFASSLSIALHRTVIDDTGLTGKYDFTLKYAPEPHELGKFNNGSTEQAPSIFTALEEQLGLKLQPSKGPVDTLVIDHVEKPTQN